MDNVKVKVNIKKFGQDVKKYDKKFLTKLNEMIKQIAVQLFHAVVDTTPRDTGLARDSWQKGARRGLNGIHTWHIQNKAPHIVKLDEGHSPQQAKGFVLRAIRKTKNWFKGK